MNELIAELSDELARYGIHRSDSQIEGAMEAIADTPPFAEEYPGNIADHIDYLNRHADVWDDFIYGLEGVLDYLEVGQEYDSGYRAGLYDDRGDV